jgi:arabinan endo-1,5-alpha-L-arabinosidase
VFLLSLCSCGVTLFGHLSYASQGSDPLAHYGLTGETLPVLDPSIIRQGSTYYAFSTDVAGFSTGTNLPIHCSQDQVNWTTCGSVFPAGMPTWIAQKVPGILGLWAPDVSFFNGEYHIYYNGSTLHRQKTVIGLVTNRTLDPADPGYHWVDRGLVLESNPGDDFNALDPSILVDSDGSVWLTYGSYWSGIKQRQIDSHTGKLLASNPARYELATRPGVPENPIEGASLVHRGAYYYLFVSVDHCCESDVSTNNYKQAMGRSTSPHGPFVDENGTPMMSGGGTVLLKGDGAWGAPGGGTAYIDAENGDSLIIFHAHNLAQNGHPYQWVKPLQWVNDWPVIGD